MVGALEVPDRKMSTTERLSDRKLTDSDEAEEVEEPEAVEVVTGDLV